MSNIAKSNITPLGARDFTPQDLALIKRTVAADCNDNEFNLFISYCRALQLDPRRKQIYALVYSKDDPSKRKMSIIVAIDGFRSIAARTGNYRPDDEEPRYEIDPALAGPANPKGIIKAVVKVWQFAHGQWFPVTASARWEEFAPVKNIADSEDAYEWIDTGEVWPDSGKPKRKKKLKAGASVQAAVDPSGKWASMPFLMLAKCAEAQALRKAWPDHFANVYAPEEMDQASVEILDPIEAVHQAETQDRIAKIGGGGRAVLFDFLESNKPLESVPLGQIGDRILAFIKDHADEPSQIRMFSDRNRHGLREYWAHAPGEALEIKQAMEKAEAAADIEGEP